MKVKHIVMTRWWKIPNKVESTILDDHCLNERLLLLKNNLLVSLNNQTNQDFEFILCMHPKHKSSQVERVQNVMDSFRTKFPCKIKIHDDSLENYVSSIWKENDVVIQTRIDDDDFVNKNAVQDCRDLIENTKFNLILCGYQYGYKYFKGTNVLYPMKKGYLNGHMSIFQSIIANTKSVEYSKNTNPFVFNHTRIRQELEQTLNNVWFVSFDRPDGFIWFRHKNAISYTTNNTMSNAIRLDDIGRNKVESTFGIKFN